MLEIVIFGAVTSAIYAMLAVGFTLIFGGVVLARMRAILANQQAEARLRRKALAAGDL